MATISQAPATLDIVAVKGDDLTITLTITENGSPYSWTGATVATSIMDVTGTAVATNFTSATPTNGTLVLTLTDTQTNTLGVATYRWQVNVTKASATRTWLAGALSVMQPGWGGTSTSSASLSITTGAATVAVAGQLTGATGATGPQGPTGPTGATGATGTAATIAVGTVTTGAPGSAATVTNAGTSSAAVFNFSIPQGVAGATVASGVSVADTADYYVGTNVESVLAEIGSTYVTKISERPRALSSFPGVVGDGVTDDTSAIQAAINTGIPIAVGRNTHLITQLKLQTKTRLEGFGYDSWFRQKAGFSGPMFVLNSGNVELTVLKNLRLNGNKTVQTTTNHGIYFDNTGFTGTYSDPGHLIENVIVEQCKGNGVHLLGKASECQLINVFAYLNDGAGFYIDWADNHFRNCVAANNGQAGFHLTSLASNSRLTGCKAFFNGAAMTVSTDRGEGFYLAGASGNELAACEAQDNYGHGFGLNAAFDNVLSACGADSNGQFAGLTLSSGFYLISSSRNKIQGYSKNRAGRTTQQYGAYLDFATGTNTANDINIAVTANTTRAINVWTVTTSGTNNSIVLGASNGGLQRLGTGATPDIVDGSIVYFVLTGGMTVNHVTNRWPGMRVAFIFQQDATGGRVISWNSAYKIDPTWTPNTGSALTNTIEFIFDGSVYRQIGGRTAIPA